MHAASALLPLRAVVAGAALTFAASALCAAPRVASINLCTDQLLLDLADRSQVLGLSRNAGGRFGLWDPLPVGDIPVLSGGAEEILVLRPDVVVTGRVTNRGVRDFLRARGQRLEEFAVLRSLKEARGQILRMGAIVGQEERARRRVAELDAAIARAREIALVSPLRALAVQRRGWVAGEDTLTTSLMSAVGLVNAAAGRGLRAGRQLDLESIVALRPDVLIIVGEAGMAVDQGSALLQHPALEATLPPSRRIAIPEMLLMCSGPSLIAVVERLAAELSRLQPLAGLR